MKMPVLEFLPAAGLAKVTVVALAAAVVLVPSFWMDALGLFGAALAAALYSVTFAALLILIRLPEALDLQQRILSQLAASRSRLRARSPLSSSCGAGRFAAASATKKSSSVNGSA